jgi:hypothetical protein
MIHSQLIVRLSMPAITPRTCQVGQIVMAILHAMLGLVGLVERLLEMPGPVGLARTLHRPIKVVEKRSEVERQVSRMPVACEADMSRKVTVSHGEQQTRGDVAGGGARHRLLRLSCVNVCRVDIHQPWSSLPLQSIVR